MPDSFDKILSARLTRRSLVKYSSFAALTSAITLSGIPFKFTNNDASAKTSGDEDFWRFNELLPKSFNRIDIAEGYKYYPVLSWGDPLFENALNFNPGAQSVESQKGQVGYNNDFISFFAINEKEALLGINHEYTSPGEMFSFMDIKPKDCGAIQLEAVGVTIAHIKSEDGVWSLKRNSKFNRKITATTKIDITGVARGNERLRTNYDKNGEFVYGTLANCNGGKTPWNTMLSAEENIEYYFSDKLADGHLETKNYASLEIGTKDREKHMAKIDPRFSLSKEPNEANRFGYIVEIDPFDPGKTPKKLTSLGRFAHECAACTLSYDNKVVVYMADDAMFEHVYKFVSKDALQEGINEDVIFDDGVLYVAKFYENGALEWIPLIYGNEGLAKKDGFDDQAAIAIETRRAAKNVGATKMDRPEGITIDPANGRVYIALTNNTLRTSANSSNPRVNNKHGHVIELSVENKRHGGLKDSWDILFLGNGDKNLKKHQKISCPDNLTYGPDNRLWIATDGMRATLGKNDALFACDTGGKNKGVAQLFLQGPRGAEICSPCFSADSKTLFVSIQHPNKFNRQWPDNNPNWPSRSSVIAITKS